MTNVHPQTFRLAVSQITDGTIFEDFANSYLAAVLSYKFNPVGGLHDRGIDGVQHLYSRDGFERQIFQHSVEQNPEAKINKTMASLSKNDIEFDSFTYVTNREVKQKDILTDRLFEKFGKSFRFFDLAWLTTQLGSNPQTINSYLTFVDSYLHEFEKPQKDVFIKNFVGDPTLYVFLKQQWEENKESLKLNEVLADTLILFALEGTDPDKNKLRTRKEIDDTIRLHIKFDSKLLQPIVSDRLVELNKKPRRLINYHTKENAYCLPYETRLELKERKLSNVALYNAFCTETEKKFKKSLKELTVSVRKPMRLLEETINQLFYQQGLEFSDFVIHNETKDAVEKDLPSLISKVVEDSTVVVKNKEFVKSALLHTIRDIIYDGSSNQKAFLKSLSHTYMMLFLLRCEPSVAMYFSSLASKLNVYVCNSIIVPALSEYYVEPMNRRHWNLLVGSRDAGVTLIVNELIVEELVRHFKKIKKIYEEEYKSNEEFYLADTSRLAYIKEILIRAYFYAKIREQVDDFDSYLDNFINPSFYNAKENIITWLKVEFGISYRTTDSTSITLDSKEVNKLEKALMETTFGRNTARCDTSVILTIFALRRKNNEADHGSIFGYKTWWLSKDTKTQNAVNKVFNKYNVSCYLRPDFLSNYVSLTPSKLDVDNVFDEMFPSLVGVNISANLPNEVIDSVHSFISEHGGKNRARVQAALQEMTEKLKTDPNRQNKSYLENFFKKTRSDW